MPDERVYACVRRVGGYVPAILHDRTHLFDEIGFDSLDLLDFTMELEKEFDLEIDDAVAQRWNTVGDVQSFVRAAQSSARGEGAT